MMHPRPGPDRAVLALAYMDNPASGPVLTPSVVLSFSYRPNYVLNAEFKASVHIKIYDSQLILK